MAIMVDFASKVIKNDERKRPENVKWKMN